MPAPRATTSKAKKKTTTTATRTKKKPKTKAAPATKSKSVSTAKRASGNGKLEQTKPTSKRGKPPAQSTRRSALASLPGFSQLPIAKAVELDHIEIRGAREHNLKNIDVDIPKKALVVFTGVSGSGKTSLAFDTVFAEGQRRYVESLSAYARQFLGQMEKPKYETIRGLSPTISIEQKAASKNPRSTVGTITEIYDYLRVLYARVGVQFCHICGSEVGRGDAASMVEQVMKMPSSTKLLVLAPIVENRKGEHRELFAELRAEGFSRVRIDGVVRELTDVQALAKHKKHNIEVVVDRLVTKNDDEFKRRLTDSIETALRLGNGHLVVHILDREDIHMSEARTCCGFAFPQLDPPLFSFNAPMGMCPACNGLGSTMLMDPDRIIPDKTLSIREGAVLPWKNYFANEEDREGGWDGERFAAMEKQWKINFDTPWSKLPQKQRDLILYGPKQGEKAQLKVKWKHERGGGEWAVDYKGLVNSLMRRYQSSQSEEVKAWLARFMSTQACASCGGMKLKPEVLAVKIGGHSIIEITMMTTKAALEWIDALELDGNRALIATEILKEIGNRLRFLVNVGLDYLSIDRRGPTLSGGEAQRIRLASQIGSELTGVLYILDEPSIGLHQRDNRKLIDTLKHLRDIGNTLIVVEHDEETMASSDWIVDFGPGAGHLGGQIVASGPPNDVAKNKHSITGKYIAGTERIPMPETRREAPAAPPRSAGGPPAKRNSKTKSQASPPTTTAAGRKSSKKTTATNAPNGSRRAAGAPPDTPRWLQILNARENNLKNVDVRIPLGIFTCITGVSGAGKSTLINQILFPALARHLHDSADDIGAHDQILGLEHLDKVIAIDQQPIGRTPRSNPATYTKVFDHIRDFFAQLPESRMRGFNKGRFSFNVKGGRCEHCQGDGAIKVEMHFLADVYVPCEVCKGRRFNAQTLQVHYKTNSIADVLEMSVAQARELFDAHPKIARIMDTLLDVGLGYIKLGQSATTLSGGEAQRIKLARELAKVDTGRTLYILDEPTTGLHFEDIRKLLTVLQRLADAGNTVVVIEHNLDVIKCADWLIDLGPEGGEAGGQIIAQGPPEHVAQTKTSYTGHFLSGLLGKA